MRHNHVVSSNPKSTRIPQVDRLSTGPWDLGCHNRSHGMSTVCCTLDECAQPMNLLDLANSRSKVSNILFLTTCENKM